ncbi:hypothetical protein D5S17_14785 [Pseudonocardiaceae bacterium YIM PH 21723]|nr:hypothetical protein D5S17_14785 [Pseudonocardiaceae bacterium YIM PH 21723]
MVPTAERLAASVLVDLRSIGEVSGIPPTLGELGMDVDEAIARLFQPADVPIQSSDYLAGNVRRKVTKLAEERRENGQEIDQVKPRLIPVPDDEHQKNMHVMPWELLHLLGRATVLSGHGSSRALAQHWSCLKYITTLQSNPHGRMELSPDGKDPRYHRRSVQAEDLGIAFALAAALRIAQRRHPDYRFEIVDADVALEAGWALRGNQVKAKPHTRLRPDYFLFGLKDSARHELLPWSARAPMAALTRSTDSWRKQPRRSTLWSSAIPSKGTRLHLA